MATKEVVEREGLPSRCGLVEDDMREVQYGPCTQCGHQPRPVRLFPNEPPLPILNCPQCHAGMGKSVQEQVAYGLGCPLLTPPETLLHTGTNIPQAPGNGDSERN